MRALRERLGAIRRDPAPSRLGFRLKRLWRSARFRRAATVKAPVAAMLVALAWAGAQSDFREAALRAVTEAREAVTSRPEFAIRRIEVRGAGPDVAAEIETALAPWRGASSLGADVDAIRDAVSGLGWVGAASVRLSAPETMIVTVEERRPALVWRRGETLTLLDASGAVIAPLGRRAARADLPLVAGEGADRAAAEALEIFAAAAGLGPRLRGLVRIGERRWDAVLHEGPVAMLPAAGAADAMGYLAALDAGERLTRRAVTHVDLRIAGRPTLRLTPEAAAARAEKKKPRKPGEDA